MLSYRERKLAYFLTLIHVSGITSCIISLLFSRSAEGCVIQGSSRRLCHPRIKQKPVSSKDQAEGCVIPGSSRRLCHPRIKDQAEGCIIQGSSRRLCNPRIKQKAVSSQDQAEGCVIPGSSRKLCHPRIKQKVAAIALVNIVAMP